MAYVNQDIFLDDDLANEAMATLMVTNSKNSMINEKQRREIQQIIDE